MDRYHDAALAETEGLLIPEEELKALRDKFYDVEQDFEGNRRLFFDNAGGSLRLKAAEEAFHRADRMPDCSEHSNRVAKYLEGIEEQGKRDLMECMFHAKTGTLYPGFTASQLMMDIIRVFSENARGTNVVTTMLEHPSSFDGMQHYAEVHGRELRVAEVNRESGGVDAETVIGLVDENTAILSCMAASNISGYIYDVERICRGAREKNPDILIIVDAVQHAPHASVDPEAWGADALTFAPYKFFGVRGFSVGWLSERVSRFMHHRLLGKPADDWSIGSPAPGHFAAFSQVVNYVNALGKAVLPEEDDRRTLFVKGMERIALQERALLHIMLEGTEEVPGLRHMEGVRVQMDGAPLAKRDFIIGVEFDRVPCEQAVQEYEKRGVITFERSAGSIYSKRMVEAFGSKGMVRVSPLHVHTPGEMLEFLKVTAEIAAL